MSLIEKFFLLFETDASEAATEIKKAETATKEADKAMSDAAKSGQRLASSFIKSVSAIRAFTVALGATTWALNGSLRRAGEIDALSKIADRARIATGDLDLLGRSARSLGGDVQAAQSDLKSLADNAFKAVTERGSTAANTFARLGIRLKDSSGNIKSTTQIMLDLAAATSRLSANRAESQLKKLGITDPGMIRLILSGKKAILENVEAQRRYGEITEKQVEVSRKFKNAQTELDEAVTSATNEMLAIVLPGATWILEKFKELVFFLSEHKVIVVGFFSALAVSITAFYLPAIISAATATWGLATAVLAATWPILAIIAAAALFAVILEDVYYYLTGQDSVIGGLAKKYPLVADALNMVSDAFNFLKLAGSTAFAILSDLWNAFVALFQGDVDGFKTHILAAKDKIVAAFSAIWDAVKDRFSGVIADMKNAFLDFVNSLWNLLPGWAQRWLGGEGDQKRAEQQRIEEAKTAIEAGKAGVSSVAATYIPPQAAARIENKTEVRVEAPANITINATDTAEGARRAAEMLNQRMTETFNRAAADFDTGVAR